MLVLNIIYGLLIAAAIVIIPLRIRARRRTLKEIDGLRSSFNQDMKELTKKLECRTVNGKKRIHSLEVYLLQEDIRQFRGFTTKFAPIAQVASYTQYLDAARYTCPMMKLMKKRRVELYPKLEISGKLGMYIREEKEDAWVATKECERPLFPSAVQHSKSMATL